MQRSNSAARPSCKLPHSEVSIGQLTHPPINDKIKWFGDAPTLKGAREMNGLSVNGFSDLDWHGRLPMQLPSVSAPSSTEI
jgi:hypothetical protein